MPAIEALVSDLSHTQTPPDLFNPYNQVCQTHDLPDAPAIRRRNLTRLLRAHQRLQTKTLWVFEAPSHLGARRSGAPFVNEGNFREVEEFLGLHESLEQATHSAARIAPTTRITWNLAHELDVKPLIWEALPFHPHLPNQPLTNRRPRTSELKAYLHFLTDLLAIFEPALVVAVGRVAEQALAWAGTDATYVRHPAQGGVRQFRVQLRTLIS